MTNLEIHKTTELESEVASLREEIRVLRDVLDEIRESVSYIARNGRMTIEFQELAHPAADEMPNARTGAVDAPIRSADDENKNGIRTPRPSKGLLF